MNYPSRVDEGSLPDGWNQNPSALASDTNAEFNGMVNLRQLGYNSLQLMSPAAANPGTTTKAEELADESLEYNNERELQINAMNQRDEEVSANPENHQRKRKERSPGVGWFSSSLADRARRVRQIIWKFFKFVGPGFMVAVAYIDPGTIFSPAVLKL